MLFRSPSEDDILSQPAPSKFIKGATGDWEVVIGMEIHAQVTSHAKLFSGASAEYGGPPNDHVSLVDAAMPGMLPVINEECVRQAVRTGLGLEAQINLRSVFDRCVKIEHARLFGGLNWVGVNTGVISAKRPRLGIR